MHVNGQWEESEAPLGNPLTCKIRTEITYTKQVMLISNSRSPCCEAAV